MCSKKPPSPPKPPPVYTPVNTKIADEMKREAIGFAGGDKKKRTNVRVPMTSSTMANLGIPSSPGSANV